jgi:hypothetical protein
MKYPKLIFKTKSRTLAEVRAETHNERAHKPYAYVERGPRGLYTVWVNHTDLKPQQNEVRTADNDA